MSPKKTSTTSNTPTTQDFDREFRAQVAQMTAGLAPTAFTNAWADWASHLALSPAKQQELQQHAASARIEIGEGVPAEGKGSEGYCGEEPNPVHATPCLKERPDRLGRPAGYRNCYINDVRPLSCGWNRIATFERQLCNRNFCGLQKEPIAIPGVCAPHTVIPPKSSVAAAATPCRSRRAW